MQNYDDLSFLGRPIYHFNYEEFGIQGVGKSKRPIVNMDNYISHDIDEELHNECTKGLAMCSKFYKTGIFTGDTTPEEEERLQGKSWTRILKDIEKHDPTGIHRKAIQEIAQDPRCNHDMSAAYNYIYYAMDCVMPWFFGLYLKENSFFGKTEGGTYTEAAEYFPKLIQYIETLPFKHVGRILFFTTFPNTGVTIHRDGPMQDHCDHNINLFFTSGSRKSFVWDEVKKEKVYLEQDARSYFFNNRDYHGVDPETSFRYTLRIDGTFTDELCEELGLENGYTWKETY